MAEKIKKQNKVLNFFKANLALVIVGVCVACIIAIIAVESAKTNVKNTMPDISINGGGISSEIVDGNPLTFELPLVEYTIAMDYTDGDNFVYSSTLNEWTTHKGVDFVAKGNRDVKAVADGTIESIVTNEEHGTKIVINHGDGLKSIYSSLTVKTTVHQGDKVKKGDKIGEAGDTSYLEFKQGPHVHFEMTKDGKHINPREYLNLK